MATNPKYMYEQYHIVVLWVDDDETVLELGIDEFERKLGVPVETYSNPDLALHAIKINPEKYGAILTDWKMYSNNWIIQNGNMLKKEIKNIKPTLADNCFVLSGFADKSPYKEQMKEYFDESHIIHKLIEPYDDEKFDKVLEPVIKALDDQNIKRITFQKEKIEYDNFYNIDLNIAEEISQEEIIDIHDEVLSENKDFILNEFKKKNNINWIIIGEKAKNIIKYGNDISNARSELNEIQEKTGILHFLYTRKDLCIFEEYYNCSWQDCDDFYPRFPFKIYNNEFFGHIDTGANFSVVDYFKIYRILKLPKAINIDTRCTAANSFCYQTLPDDQIIECEICFKDGEMDILSIKFEVVTNWTKSFGRYYNRDALIGRDCLNHNELILTLNSKKKITEISK